MIPIKRGKTYLFPGDSTADVTSGDAHSWYQLNPDDGVGIGGFVNDVNNRFNIVPSTVTGLRSTCVGLPAVNTAKAGAIVVYPGGVGGNEVSQVLARLPALLTASNPDGVFVTCGVNDYLHGIPNGTTTTDYAAILSTIQAFNPAINIACMAVYMDQEVWATGPVWNNASDAAIATLNSIISAAAAAAGATFIDTRSAFLIWESTHNPSKLATGVATLDGVHLNATGKLAISGFVQPYCNIIPY